MTCADKVTPDRDVLYAVQRQLGNVMEVVQPGKWYLTVICHHCRERVAVMLDPHQGDEPEPYVYERQIQTVICGLCKQQDDYAIGEVERAKGLPPERPN